VRKPDGAGGVSFLLEHNETISAILIATAGLIAFTTFLLESRLSGKRETLRSFQDKSFRMSDTLATIRLHLHEIAISQFLIASDSDMARDLGYERLSAFALFKGKLYLEASAIASLSSPQKSILSDTEIHDLLRDLSLSVSRDFSEKKNALKEYDKEIERIESALNKAFGRTALGHWCIHLLTLSAIGLQVMVL
jgi:hypothetical protein